MDRRRRRTGCVGPTGRSTRRSTADGTARCGRASWTPVRPRPRRARHWRGGGGRLSTFLEGPAGPLEILYRPPEGPLAPGLPPAALVCHPHPAHGGTMHNKVVYRIARGLLESGLAVLRFNFRGVGLSAGTFADGVGERDDIRAALDGLAARHPGADLLLAGFSFGAYHGVSVGARDPRVTRFVLAGLPVDKYGAEPVSGGGRPVFCLHGEHDAFATPDAVAAWAAAWEGPAEVAVVRGVDHFFEPRLPLVAEEVRRHLSGAPGTGVRWV